MYARDVTRWAAIAAVCILTAVGVALLSVGTVSGNTNSNCIAVQQLKGAIVNTLQRSDKLLGVKGGSSYAYYRAHPDELTQAHRDIRHEIHVFQPAPC
jgi:hypothetical protein